MQIWLEMRCFCLIMIFQVCLRMDSNGLSVWCWFMMFIIDHRTCLIKFGLHGVFEVDQDAILHIMFSRELTMCLHMWGHKVICLGLSSVDKCSSSMVMQCEMMTFIVSVFVLHMFQIISGMLHLCLPHHDFGLSLGLLVWCCIGLVKNVWLQCGLSCFYLSWCFMVGDLRIVLCFRCWSYRNSHGSHAWCMFFFKQWWCSPHALASYFMSRWYHWVNY